MGKDSPSPPAAPDYAGAAQAQGAANVEAARLSARMANPNIIGPYGSQSVSYGQPFFDQGGYNKALLSYQQDPTGASRTAATNDIASLNAQIAANTDPQGRYDPAFDAALSEAQGRLGALGQGSVMPTREQFTSANADQPTVTQTLTPAAQSTLDAQQRVQRSLAGLGEQGIGTAQKVLGTPFSFGGPAIQTSLGNAGQISQTPDLSRFGQASGNINQQIGSAQDPQFQARMNELRAGGMQIARMNTPSKAELASLDDPFLARVNDRNSPRSLGQTSRDFDANGSPIYQRPREQIDFETSMRQPSNQPNGNLAQAPQAPELSVYGMAGAGPSAGQYGFAQGGLNTSNVAAMPVNAGMTGQQAIMNRLAPQLERADAATRQRLVNQGLVPGGEAYENAMISQNQQKNDLLSQAALQGIGLDTAANAQGFGQALQAGQFGNQAVAQNFGLGQAANAAQNAAIGQNQQAALAQYQAQLGGQQQGFGQQVTQRQLGNQAIGQNQQAALAQQQAALAAQNQQYNQLLQGAQFGNTAQQQSLAQQLQLRNQPLNEIIGLMGGSQIQMPQFQGYQGSNIAPAPIFAGAQATGQAGMQNYGIESANVNAQNAGLYNLLGSGAMAYGMKR